MTSPPPNAPSRDWRAEEGLEDLPSRLRPEACFGLRAIVRASSLGHRPAQALVQLVPLGVEVLHLVLVQRVRERLGAASGSSRAKLGKAERRGGAAACAMSALTPAREGWPSTTALARAMEAAARSSARRCAAELLLVLREVSHRGSRAGDRRVALRARKGLSAGSSLKFHARGRRAATRRAQPGKSLDALRAVYPHVVSMLARRLARPLTTLARQVMTKAVLVNAGRLDFDGKLDFSRLHEARRR